MRRIAILSLACLFTPVLASAQDKDAKTVAQDLLTKGAALFDNRDAAVMAETYTEDARLALVSKDRDTGKFKIDLKEGRSEIEKGYKEFFSNSKERTTSKNTVEYAKFLTPDLLLIYGEFEPVVNQGKFAFTQERVRQGDRWLIQNLRLYIVSPD